MIGQDISVTVWPQGPVRSIIMFMAPAGCSAVLPGYVFQGRPSRIVNRTVGPTIQASRRENSRSGSPYARW